MNRVSTANGYTTVLANMNDAQLRQIKAAGEVSSQKKGDDLKTYARNAETLTAMKAVQTRVAGFLEQNRVLTDRFATQDIALNQIGDAAEGARQAITEALASGRGDTLMQELRGFFADAVSGLNTKSQGKYLFAGGQLNTQPVSAIAMSDLTSVPSVSGFFHNDRFIAESRLDESSAIQGAFLADDLGTDLFNAFRTLQAFEESPAGAFGGDFTDAQRTFLEAQLLTLDTVRENLVNKAAQNGAFERRIAAAKIDLQSRETTLEGMVGDITDVDVPSAIMRLQQAQTAVQAGAHVFAALQNSSLLNYIQP